MKNAILFTLLAILAISISASADVKIKTKQTMSGQTTENTTYIKGKRERTEMMGGIAISISQCDIGRDLQLFPQTRTYTVTTYKDGTTATTTGRADTSSQSQKGGTMFVTTTIRDTGERKQMFGFTARHIIQTIETETSADACAQSKTKMEMESWVIDAEFGLPCSQTRTYRPYNGGKAGGCTDKIVPKTIGSAKSGYPLWQKMTAFDESGKETFSTVQEVVEMSKATLEASLFEAPSDYRQVKDAAQAYAAQATSETATSDRSSLRASMAASNSASSIARPTPAAGGDQTAAIGPKLPGTIRLGIAAVKTAAIGDGISASELSAAIGNSLREFLKGSKVEVVTLDTRLPSAQTGEAKQKECDLVITATVSHKKGGGGGFGFGRMLGQVVGQTGLGATGSVAGNIAAGMATTAIVTAGNLSGSLKAKDELTLDVKLVSIADNSSPLSRQFKAKAKSDGDDIITSIVEQAAQAIIDAIGK